MSTTLSGKKNFSLFHVNTGSLSKNFDQLLSVLSSLKFNFDLIGITETKQQIGKDFLVNVDENDYFMYTQPSQVASGGVAIYVTILESMTCVLQIMSLRSYGLGLKIEEKKIFYVDVLTVTRIRIIIIF